MELIVVLIVGIIVGLILGRLIFCPKLMGNLRVDCSDPDGPYLFLEMSGNLYELAEKNFVRFKVNVRNYISQD